MKEVALLVGRAWRLARGLVSRLTLVQRFSLVSLAILVTGAFIIGRYVAEEIVSPSLQDIGRGPVSGDKRNELDRLLVDTSLGREIVSFKVWDPQGSIVYAKDPALIGRQFGLHKGLAAALAGNVQAGISDLQEEENRLERLEWSRLLETYAPVREHETGAIIGAMEFYEDPSDLESEIDSSQRNGWIIVGLSTAGMYLLLVGLVKGASNTLASQHKNLGRLAQDNAQLAERVRKAAARKTETDEQLLMRIGQDLHDGPAQDLGLALLRIRALRQGTEIRLSNQDNETLNVGEDFQLVETALDGALKEIREISSDLHLPELDALTLPEVAEKAKFDYERKTGAEVAMHRGAVPASASLPLKIAVYRLLQEALNNSYRHGGAMGQRISISHAHGWLMLEVGDAGPGFDPMEAGRDEDAEVTLGLRGMRERVEMLVGNLDVDSGPGRGTTIHVRLPLQSEVT
jgi:signal transduction histidine kinase